MREEEEFRIECIGLSQGGPLSSERSKAGREGATSPLANSVVPPVNGRPAGVRAARTVACFLGALVVLLAMLGAPAVSSAGVAIGIAVSFGPPALPYYAQPPCPAPGYIWTPGYWAWDPAYGYYWVPGTWVPAPFIGALWTPGYWDFDDGGYRWHAGYWGPEVGFYGGINYGYGYTGDGYHGGYWDHDRFYYNRSVNRIDTRNITHVYYRSVVENNRFARVSYHGGPGGTFGGPTRGQMAAARMRRYGPVGDQIRQERFARTDPVQRASFNHGRPEIAATPRPGMFRGYGIERANRPGAPYRAPVQRTAAPYRGPNRQGFQRAQSYSAPRYNAPRYAAPHYAAPRYAAPRRQMQGRAPQRQYAQRPAPRQNFQRGRPAPGRNFQRGPYQARQQQVRRPVRYAAPQRHGPPPRQEQRGGGGHGRGRGGRR